MAEMMKAQVFYEAEKMQLEQIPIPHISDIDVLVVLKGPVSPGEEIERSGDLIADLSLANNVVISCVFMDEDRFLPAEGPDDVDV